MSSLDDLVVEGVIESRVPIGRLTTYKLGGPADFFAEVTDRAGLDRVLESWRGSDLPILVLGWGSNLVVADGGFRGLVIRLAGEFSQVRLDENEIRAGGAVRLPLLARSAVAAGRLGLEFYVGIPGTVGGAVRQNAGCHGSDTAEWLISAAVLDSITGMVSERSGTDLDLSYRHSTVAATDVVLDAGFRFLVGSVEEGEERLREVTRWRKEHQPGGTLNAGSVFKNPPGDAAGRLIDAAGLKGLRIGGVSVSERHANFFVADADATARDLARLIDEVRRRVIDRFGVELEPEVCLVGDFEA